MIKTKNKIHSKYLKTKKSASHEYYVTLRNTVNKGIKQEKKAYMKSGTVNNNNIPNKLLKPQEINDHFLKVAGPSMVDDNLLSFYNNNRLNPNLRFTFKQTDDDILNVLKTIKNQVLGVNNIDIKMLLIIVPYCVDILKHIFNESIHDTRCPSRHLENRKYYTYSKNIYTIKL